MEIELDGLSLIVRLIDFSYERWRKERFDAFIDSKDKSVVNTTLTDIRRQIARARD